MSIEIAPVFGALYITNGQSTLIVRQTPGPWSGSWRIRPRRASPPPSAPFSPGATTARR